jgi:hypothetical protein
MRIRPIGLFAVSFHCDQRWWLIDPTRLAAIDRIVGIGSGGDASDIGFLLRQTIGVSSL